MVAAERVRSAIEASTSFQRIRKGSSGELRGEVKTHHLTISIGVAAYPDDSRDPIEVGRTRRLCPLRAKRSGERTKSALIISLASTTERVLPPRRTIG